MLGIISKPKKLLALVLAFVLMLSVVPLGYVFANSEPQIVVVDPSAALEGPTTDLNGDIVFKTIPAAIDYFEGAEGKIYLKGALIASGVEIEGTTANRAPITIAGYGNDATGGTLEVYDVHDDWLKGDITFENITIGVHNIFDASGHNNHGFNSGGHKITFGKGIVSAGALKAGGRYSHSGNFIEFNSGKFDVISARYGLSDDEITTGATHYVLNNGVSVDKLTAGMEENNAVGTINMVDDYVLDINGGYFDYLYLGSMCVSSATANKADTIININKLDKVPDHGIMFAHPTQHSYQAADPLEVNKYGNVAVVMDCAGMPGKVSAYNYYWSGYSFIPDENKYFMFIANNYDASKFEIVKYDEEVHNINSLDYIIHTVEGVAQPVFEDATPGDATSSVLKGFTFENNANSPYLVPAANGIRLNPTGEITEDGKLIYDLSAYKGTRTAKTITNEGGGSLATHITNTKPVTITFIESVIPIVSTDEDFVAPEGYKVFPTINAAIGNLGTEGGNIYIKGDYDLGSNIKEAFANTAIISEGKGINILGWADSNTIATDNKIIFEYNGNQNWDDNDDVDHHLEGINSAWLHCDITFDDINVVQENTHNAGFYSNGNTITFGDNVLTTGSFPHEINGEINGEVDNALTIGYRDSILEPTSNNIIINSGIFKGIYTAQGWFVDATYNVDTNIIINGGSVDGPLSVLGSTDSPGTRVINGDINYTVNANGSDDLYFYGISLGGAGSNGSNNTTVNGNVTFRLNGLKGNKINFDTEYGINLIPPESSIYNGNIAVIFDFEEDFWFNTIVPTDSLQANLKGKVMLIANNVGSDYNAKWDDSWKNKVHYLLEVVAGSVEPVYGEELGTLKGFEIKGPEGSKPYARNMITGEEIKLTAGEDGLYDLSALENQGRFKILFDCEKYYVKYGGTGDGKTPETPAKSVAWLINNTIATEHTADENVEIYIMQDDAEILYNSTAYVTDDVNYEPQQIGRPNASAMPGSVISHITAWNSASDGTPKAHEATIIIKSYDDPDDNPDDNPDSALNYLAFDYQLGANVPLILQGPTVFDDIKTVSMRGGSTGIWAGGHDMTLTANHRSYNVNVDSYREYHTWDGQFIAMNSGTSTGTGSSYGYATSIPMGDGGKVIYQALYDSNNEISIGTIGNDSTVYNGDTTVVIDTPQIWDLNNLGETTIKIAPNTTTFGSINILINYEGIVNVTGGANATVNEAVQLIRDVTSSSRWPHLENQQHNIPIKTLKTVAEQNNVPFFNVQFYTEFGPFLDVYTENGEVVYGKYAITQNVIATAYEHKTGKLIHSKKGVLDLTEFNGGDFTITAVSLDGKDYANVGDMIYAVNKTKVNLSEQDHSFKEKYAFMGWQLNGQFVRGNSITLEPHEFLEAVYYDYDLENNFTIEGVQMRLANETPDVEQGVRFIIKKSTFLEKKLMAQGATIPQGSEPHYGAIVLPTELTHGKDMELGKPIYAQVDAETTKLLGTPSKVPGVKTFAKAADGSFIQYTLLVKNIKQSNFFRNYSVYGYLRYLDANGNEQVLYSDYGQSSLYRVALQAKAGGITEDDNVNEIIDYVENTRPQKYLTHYDPTKTSLMGSVILNKDNYRYFGNLDIYEYSNGLRVSEFSIDWNYNPDVADSELATNVIDITDVHLNYVNREDFGNRNPAILNAYKFRTWVGNGEKAAATLTAMEYALLFGDKTVVTGDILDYISEGCAQMTDRLIFNYNTAIDGTSSVLATLGNHEPTMMMQSKIPDTTENADDYAWLQEFWPNDINYHSEVVTNDNGKNPVKVILLNDQTGNYEELSDEDVAQFEADLADARTNNIPVLIFQHEALSDGTSTMYGLFNTNHCTTFAAKPEDGDGVITKTERVYTLITDNADIVRGIFCGHHHDYCYSEIPGSGEASELKIPQILFYANVFNPSVLNINITTNVTPETPEIDNDVDFGGNDWAGGI